MLMVVCLMAVLPVSRSAAFDDPLFSSGDTELTMYGWLRNNIGLFTDDIDYAYSGNDLATCRTWLRTYLDMTISKNLRVWAAIQFAHEPTYQSEKYSMSTNSRHAGVMTLSDGKEYSEYYRVADVLRELYIEWQMSLDNSIRVGRQIVVWGESLTTRVNDVIHPEDSRFTFAFANLEDTRIPMWMIKGITH